ncbi:MAG: glycerate kinase [Vicinamibacterales bacterium]
MRAGVARASARAAVLRALADPAVSTLVGDGPVSLIAAGKAAAAMAEAALSTPLAVRDALAVGTHAEHAPGGRIEWHEAGHPFPDERSMAAAARALALASRVPTDGCLLVLLSGGASALLAHPAGGLTLSDKRAAVRALMLGGADIHALNTVRKHISAIKGGRLATACPGRTVTLAVSDVVGDDLAVIGSGPSVPDPSTWSDVAAVLEPFGDQPALAPVVALCRRGLAGEIPDTPKPGDPRMAGVSARVIGGRLDAMAGASVEAAARGYRVLTIDEPVVGDARTVAPQWLERALTLAGAMPGPAAITSGGETTVTVTGAGRGGRNQEFALALADHLAHLGRPAVAASIGTDGIDGPTPAAGAVVDGTTLGRASELGLDPPRAFLDRNDSFAFFSALGDLIETGRTDTNVGDLQVLLLG